MASLRRWSGILFDVSSAGLLGLRDDGRVSFAVSERSQKSADSAWSKAS
jgi:hypothetical protein